MKDLTRTIAVAAATALITALVSTQLALNWTSLTEQQRTGTGQTLEQQTTIRRTTREESAVIEAIKASQDAVVSVIVTKDLPVIERYYEQGNPFGDPFMSPFEFQIPQYRQRGTEEREIGGGTAFFISADGLLFTNKHVVSDEDAAYTVLLNDGTKLEATVAAKDSANDIALLKVDGDDFTALPLAEDELQLGQTVIAIGNALGEFRNTVSVGVISGLKRNVTAGTGMGGPVEQLEHIIQTDAAINQGNSGGPLLNTKGEVVGMNTAIAASAQNIGFAIPAPDLRIAVESFEEHGKILRAFLGVRYMPITQEVKEKNNLAYDEGVLIVRGEQPGDLAVIPGSPADKAGLAENDIILEINGEKLTIDRSLASVVRRQTPGDTVRLKIVHDGEEKEVEVTLSELE